MQLGQTVTVVNRSGKVVKSSKHLVNIFNEAKSAYRERKAEIKATRHADLDETRARRGLKDMCLEDDTSSRASSRESRTSERSKRHRTRPAMERGYSDSFYTNDEPPQSPRINRRSHLRFEQDVDEDFQRSELVRRNTDGTIRPHARPRSGRSSSMSDIDMDLAYGEIPPPLPPRRYDNEIELRTQMSKLQILLDEANCVQHSVISTIEHLQDNPDALAAVALTLAEISNIATKMGPGVLTAMKGSFPLIVALLASPEFMIAAGVGVGVTIIALGGYKIIKKIKQRKADNKALESGDVDELQEVESDLSHIELWRRGIAEADAESIGTSVEGEFVTPAAGRQLIADGVLREEDLKSTRSTKSKKSKAKSKSKSQPMRKSMRSDDGSSVNGDRKKKEPSGLRLLFSKKEHKPDPALI